MIDLHTTATSLPAVRDPAPSRDRLMAQLQAETAKPVPVDPSKSTIPDPDAPEGAQRLDPLEKARLNPTSRKLAIAAKCFDCQGRDDDPGVRERIRTCLSPGCPLYAVRPYRDSPAVEAARLEALAERASHLRALGIR